MYLSIRSLFIFLVIMSSATIASFGSCRGFEILAPVNTFLNATSFLLLVYSVCLTIIKSLKKKKIVLSNAALLILGLYIYYIICTYLNGGSIARKVFTVNISIVILMDLLLSGEINGETKFLNYSVKWMNFLGIINFVSVVLLQSQDGFIYFDSLNYQRYGYYLLSGKNGHILLLLPLMSLNYIMFKKHNKYKYLFFNLLYILNSILVGSATSFIMQIMWLAIILFGEHLKDFKKIISSWKFWLVFLTTFFFFFIYNQEFEKFSALFQLLFKKDMVSQNRGVLYALAMQRVKNNFLFGYGYFLSDKFTLDGYQTSHNFVLDCLLYGGVIALIWYIIIISRTLLMGKRYLYKKTVFYLLAAIIPFLIGGFIDGYQFYTSWFLFNVFCLMVTRADSLGRIGLDF